MTGTLISRRAALSSAALVCCAAFASGPANNIAREGPWIALHGRVLSASGCQAKGASFRELACLPLTAHARILIATVADPEATHLALFLDRAIESLIWAAGDAGYSFESYWLPWTVASPNRGASAAMTAGAPPAQRAYPGVLVFRGPNSSGDPLLIFLVGETPTSGANRAALENAIGYAVELSDSPAHASSRPRIKIVGPSFSGSMRSLAKVIDPWIDRQCEFEILSGMATSEQAATEFKKHFSGRPLSYAATVENDQRTRDLFLNFVESQWSAGTRIAILSESDTDYARPTLARITAAGAHSEILQIRYPREVARLRNAYQEPPTTDSTAPAAQPSLPLLLRDSSGHDSTPAFATAHTPLSQEAVLLEIAATLRRERIEYAGIVATDPLDIVFLCRFLRQACPNIRLFVHDADLLLARAVVSAPIEGVLALTDYPMFAANQRWSGSGATRQRSPAAGRYAQGLYNACRLLLQDSKSGGLVEYGPPRIAGLATGFAADRPPTWVVALGHGEYWPVALLNPSTSKVESTLAAGIVNDNPSVVSLGPEQPSGAWLLLFAVVHVFAVALSVFLIARYWKGKSGFAPPLFRSYPDAARARHWPFLAVSSVVVIAAAWIFCAPLIRMAAAGAAMLAAWASALVIAFALAAAIAACQGIYRRGAAQGTSVAAAAAVGAASTWAKDSAPGQRPQPAFMVGTLLLAVAGLCAFAALWASLVWRSAYGAGFLFAYRTLFPESGVSPAVPMLALLASMYAWTRMQLQRSAYAPSVLPPLSLPTRRIDQQFESALHRDWLWRAVGLFALWFILFQPHRTLASLEHWSYTATFAVLASILFFVTIAAWLQFITVWLRFRAMLQTLEKHPIRTAFTYLPKHFVGPLWSASTRIPTLLISYRGLDCLRALVTLETQGQPGDVTPIPNLARHCADYAGDLNALAAASAGGDRPYAAYIATANDVATCLVDHLNNNGWKRGLSESLERALETRPKAPMSLAEQQTVLAQEFVVLRLISYIGRIIRQLRDLLVFVVAGSVLPAMAMLLYPFEARQAINIHILVTFAMIGAGVVFVLADMERDPLLSRITEKRANQLGKGFLLKLATAGAAPVLTVVASQFPAIRETLLSWIEPALRAIR